MTAADIVLLLRKEKFELQDEKILQLQLLALFHNHIPTDEIEKEFYLDDKNIPDFMLFGNIAVEVKIKGRKIAIYKQCERYCQFDQVNELILITNVNMGFPEEINNKNCYVHNLAKSWL